MRGGGARLTAAVRPLPPQPRVERGDGAPQHRLLPPHPLVELVQEAQPQLRKFPFAAHGPNSTGRTDNCS